jgi:AcrR family transcriptional regulator
MSAAPQTPQTVRFLGMREALLAAAVLQFNEQGVRGATLGDIAASVGLVTTSLTYYYRKKEDLATACFLRAIAAYDALATDAASDTDRAPDVAARVTRFFTGLAGLLADIDAGRQPPLMLFSDIRALPEAQAATVFAAYTDLFRHVRALLVGSATEALGRDDLNARAHLLLSAANWLRGAIHHHEPDTYPRVAAQVADILLHGLAAPGQAGPVDAMDAVNAVAPPAAAGAAPIAAPIASPATAPGDDTGDAFLRAATELVNEQGYRGASVDRIAARLNLTKGAFYHHHENKLDLIAACFERSFDVQRQVLQAAGRAPGSGWSRSCAAATALVRFQLSPRGPLLRVTATSALPDEAHRAQVRRSLQRLNERFAGLLVDGLVDGSIRPLHPTVAAQLLAANLNAAAELRRWVPGIQPADVTRRYTRPALLGLLCAGCASADHALAPARPLPA